MNAPPPTRSWICWRAARACSASRSGGSGRKLTAHSPSFPPNGQRRAPVSTDRRAPAPVTNSPSAAPCGPAASGEACSLACGQFRQRLALLVLARGDDPPEPPDAAAPLVVGVAQNPPEG